MAKRAPKAPKKTALEKSRDRVVANGGVIMVVLAPNGGKKTYQTLNGKSVGPVTFNKLKAGGIIEAQPDGLLADAPQTYRIVK